MGPTKFNIIIVSLVCITFLEAFALYKGHNGTALTASISAIAAIVGYAFGKIGGSK